MENNRSPWDNPKKPPTISEQFMETQGPLSGMPRQGGRTTWRDVLGALAVLLLGVLVVCLAMRQQEARSGADAAVERGAAGTAASAGTPTSE